MKGGSYIHFCKQIYPDGQPRQINTYMNAKRRWKPQRTDYMQPKQINSYTNAKRRWKLQRTDYTQPLMPMYLPQHTHQMQQMSQQTVQQLQPLRQAPVQPPAATVFQTPTKIHVQPQPELVQVDSPVHAPAVVQQAVPRAEQVVKQQVQQPTTQEVFIQSAPHVYQELGQSESPTELLPESDLPPEPQSPKAWKLRRQQRFNSSEELLLDRKRSRAKPSPKPRPPSVPSPTVQSPPASKSRKRRPYKPKLDDDEDYEENEAEEDCDDDEEYREIPLQRLPKRKRYFLFFPDLPHFFLQLN